MKRRNFMLSTALLAIPGFSTSLLASNENENTHNAEPIKPFLLPAQPALEHKGGMDIRV